MGRSDKHILMELPCVFILEREGTWLDTSPSDLSLSEAFDQPPNFFGWYSFAVIRRQRVARQQRAIAADCGFLSVLRCFWMFLASHDQQHKDT